MAELAQLLTTVGTSTNGAAFSSADKSFGPLNYPYAISELSESRQIRRSLPTRFGIAFLSQAYSCIRSTYSGIVQDTFNLSTYVTIIIIIIIITFIIHGGR